MSTCNGSTNISYPLQNLWWCPSCLARVFPFSSYVLCPHPSKKKHLPSLCNIFFLFLLSHWSRSIHSNCWKTLMNNHNLLIPGKMLEKLQGSDGWWFGPNDTWTSTTLLLACLRPPATRSHLLTSSLFQHSKTQHRKGKQELLTLWIEKGRIHGCALAFPPPLLARRRNLCVWGKSRGSGFHWISPPCLCSRLLSGWTRALPAPPLGQGHLSPGDMSLFKFGTWHFQNLSNRLSSASRKFNLSNNVYLLRCTQGIADQSNLIWLNIYS